MIYISDHFHKNESILGKPSSRAFERDITQLLNMLIPRVNACDIMLVQIFEMSETARKSFFQSLLKIKSIYREENFLLYFIDVFNL